MEKFVFWYGKHNEEDILPALKLLKRLEKEQIMILKSQAGILGIVYSPQDQVLVNRPVEDILHVTLGKLEYDIDFQLSNADQVMSSLNCKGNGIAIACVGNDFFIVIEPWFRRIIYYSLNASRIVSNEMKAIIALDRSITKSIDDYSITSFVALHGFYGNRTLFKRIKVFESGTMNRISTSGIELSISSYQYPAKYNDQINVDEHITIIAKLFRESVSKAISSGVGNIFLSGGIDSRLLLAAISTSDKHKFQAIHIGIMDCTDTQLAIESAKVAGISFKFHESNAQELIENCEKQVWITECGSFFSASYLVPVSISLTSGSFCGFPGDMSLGGSHGNRYSKIPVNHQSEYAKMGLATAEVLGKFMVNIPALMGLFGKKEGKRRLLDLYYFFDEGMKQFTFASNSMLQAEYYILNNRVRRGTQTPMSEYQQLSLPYLDDTIIEQSITIPLAIRDDREFEINVLRLLDKNLANLQSTSVMEVKRTKGLINVFINTLKKTIKRIPILSSIGRMFIRSRMARSPEDSYVKLNTWMREDKDFQSFVINKLECFKKRSIVVPVEIDRLITDHLKFRENNMTILSALIDLELFYEQFVDGNDF